MKTIDKADLFECRFYSSEFALLQEHLNSLQQQEQNLRITAALIAERRSSSLEQQLKLQQKLEELAEMLETKYGVEHQDQINWETGEIAAASAAAPSAGECYTAPGVSVTPLRGRDGTETPGSPGAETTDSGRTESVGPAVE